MNQQPYFPQTGSQGRSLKRCGRRKETYTFLALSPLPAVAAQSFLVSVRRKVEIKCRQKCPNVQDCPDKGHKRQGQEAVTYLPLHALLPRFCACRGRGISRVLGTRRGDRVGGTTGNGKAVRSISATHTSKQTRTVCRPVEAGEWHHCHWQTVPGLC